MTIVAFVTLRLRLSGIELDRCCLLQFRGTAVDSLALGLGMDDQKSGLAPAVSLQMGTFWSLLV